MMRVLKSFAPLLCLLLTGAAWASPGSELARRDYDRGNYAVALEKAKPLAESGDSAAQLLLALMYAGGKGLEQSDAQAWQWYWKSAVSGNAEAQLALVGIYRDGRGVAVDSDMANYWQWKVADNFQQGEKAKLEAEITRQKTAERKNKDALAVINIEQCKMPDYAKTGWGYRASGTNQVLFVLGADGAVLEASMPQYSSWTKLDRDILNGYAKSCTFKPAKHNDLTVSSLYALSVTWTVEP